MSQENELFSHFAVVLAVSEIRKSISYYCDQLGFKVTFESNDPIDYAVLKRGEVSIHLTKKNVDTNHSAHRTSVYIFVHNVDAVYREFIDNGVAIHNPVGDRDYGMRDFDIMDPDGYILSFGKGKS